MQSYCESKPPEHARATRATRTCNNINKNTTNNESNTNHNNVHTACDKNKHWRPSTKNKLEHREHHEHQELATTTCSKSKHRRSEPGRVAELRGGRATEAADRKPAVRERRRLRVQTAISSSESACATLAGKKTRESTHSPRQKSGGVWAMEAEHRQRRSRQAGRQGETGGKRQ